MANKKLWLGMLVLALTFGMTVICCGNDLTGGGQEPVSLSLYKWDDSVEDIVGTVEIRFRTDKLYIDNLTLTDRDLFNDFKVTIDGASKSVIGLAIIYGTYLNIGIEGSYAINQEYTVRVVYTANPARKIYFNKDTGELLESFTIEKKD